MKKATSISSYLLLAFTVLNLVGEVICVCIGYDFELNSVPVYMIILTLLSVGTIVFSILSKGQTDHSITSVLPLMLPLSLVNIVLLVFNSPSIWVYVCAIHAAVCAVFLAVWHSGTTLVSKIIALVLSAIMFIPIGFCGLLGVYLADFGSVTVVETVESPSGKFRAEVIDSDQGALGGDTLVNVYNNRKHFNLLIFTISKKPQRVYTGEWRAYEHMKIGWKDDDCLVINSKEYDIK